MTSDQIAQFIDSNKNLKINGASFQRKNKNGEYVEDLSLTFFVDKKLPLDQIPSGEKIPKEVYVEGFGLVKTDVLENSFELQACADCQTTGSAYVGWDQYPTLPRLMDNRDVRRPLVGGLSISNSYPSGNEQHDNAYGAGTMGFIAIDDTDNSIVGVTNSHVAAYNETLSAIALSAHERITSNTAYKATTDNYSFTGFAFEQPMGAGDFETSMQTRRNSSNFATNALYPYGYQRSFLEAGSLKRYYPFSLTGWNTIDASLLHINTHTASNRFFYYDVTDPDQSIVSDSSLYPSTALLNPNESWKFANQPAEIERTQIYFPFASTDEINSMTGVAFKTEGATRPNIFTTGRTTGGKGFAAFPSSILDASCVYECVSTTHTASINFTNHLLKFNNLLQFTFRSPCNNVKPSQRGDSGSAWVARFNGVWKIVGLHFAGSSTCTTNCVALAVRIDYLAPLLRIRPYLGESVANNNTANNRRRQLVVRNKQSLPFFRHTDGRVYYQLGTTNLPHQIASIT